MNNSMGAIGDYNDMFERSAVLRHNAAGKNEASNMVFVHPFKSELEIWTFSV